MDPGGTGTAEAHLKSISLSNRVTDYQERKQKVGNVERSSDDEQNRNDVVFRTVVQILLSDDDHGYAESCQDKGRETDRN